MIEAHRIWEGSWDYGDLRSHVFTVVGGETGSTSDIGHKHENAHMMVVRERRGEGRIFAWIDGVKTELKADPGGGYYMRAGVQHTIEASPGAEIDISCWFAKYNRDGTLRGDPLAEARPLGKEAWNG